MLELTERNPVEDYDTLVGALDKLRAEGVRLAIDDVGAGFSSLRHVLQLEPDMMKLDVSLAHDIELDPRRQALVAAIRTFADRPASIWWPRGSRPVGRWRRSGRSASPSVRATTSRAPTHPLGISRTPGVAAASSGGAAER